MRFGVRGVVGVAGAVVVAVSLAGCGSSNEGIGPAEVQAFSGLSQDISAAAAAYATTAAGTPDVPACHAAHTDYRGEVGPMLDRMRAMSGDMDLEMERMGHAGSADMTCGADAMRAELAAHDAAACASADMAENHAEAARHAVEMEAWAEHQRERAEEMGGMMGMGGMGMGGGSAATTCTRNSDGTFTRGP